MRRYEYYAYTGAVDAASGEAKPVNGDSAPPEAGDLGNFIGAQNAALNFGAAAAPEPTTWALMMLGVGGIGGALRTRRRKTTAA